MQSILWRCDGFSRNDLASQQCSIDFYQRYNTLVNRIRICPITCYSVNEDCLLLMPPIPKALIITQTTDIQVEKEGVSHVEREMRTIDIADFY